MTHVGVDDDNWFTLVDHCITVPDAEADRGAIDIVDWAEAIVDGVRESRRQTACRRATSAAE